MEKMQNMFNISRAEHEMESLKKGAIKKSDGRVEFTQEQVENSKKEMNKSLSNAEQLTSPEFLDDMDYVLKGLHQERQTNAIYGNMQRDLAKITEELQETFTSEIAAARRDEILAKMQALQERYDKDVTYQEENALMQFIGFANEKLAKYPILNFKLKPGMEFEDTIRSLQLAYQGALWETQNGQDATFRKLL